MSLITFISIAFCTFIMAVVITGGLIIWEENRRERQEDKMWRDWWKEANANIDEALKREAN